MAAAFTLFCSENYSTFEADNPEKSAEGVARVMALAWKNLDPGTQAKYKEWATGKQHMQRLWYGYHIFVSENYAEIKARYPEASREDMTREVSSAWKDLDPETKAKYNERAAAARQGSSDSADTKVQ